MPVVPEENRIMPVVPEENRRYWSANTGGSLCTVFFPQVPTVAIFNRRHCSFRTIAHSPICCSDFDNSCLRSIVVLCSLRNPKPQVRSSTGLSSGQRIFCSSAVHESFP